MQRATVVKLVKRKKSVGVYDDDLVSERTVCALLTSIGMNESYLAMSHGFRPSVKFVLALPDEWNEETQLVCEGKTYKIIRTFENEEGALELTCERSEEDA